MMVILHVAIQCLLIPTKYVHSCQALSHWNLSFHVYSFLLTGLFSLPLAGL